MRVMIGEKLDAAKLEPHEHFFVELWYGMTHSQSLDTYRVKCMNARTLVRELSEELQIGLILTKDNSDQFKAVCTEVGKILASDPVISHQYPHHVALLQASLGKPDTLTPDTKKGDASSADEFRRFRFAVVDLTAALESTYFRHVCEALRDSIKPDNEDGIRKVLGPFLTDLIDQGWDLESLYRWHRHFLPKKSGKPYTFFDNLHFMLNKLQRGPQSYKVILRLSGSERLADITEFGPFIITETPSASAGGTEAKRFATPHPLARFAETNLASVDYLPAAMCAREAFEDQLDLLRFDYERRVVKMEDTCYVERSGDGKSRLLQVQLALPNPIENIDREGFDSFIEDVDEVCNKSCIEEASRTQLKAAIRQYRFGRDSASYRDMFLNWWMGLEALAHVGRGKGIGATVTHNVSRVMAVPYFFRILRDLQITLKYCEITWQKELAGFSQCPALADLTISQLVELLQSEIHRKLLVEQCQSFPTLAFRIQWIGEWLSEPKKALERFKSHLDNVEWQLQRIYRIRCCIVHGAPIRYRLGLIAANLEFYLKQTILLTLKAFHDNNHIRSLEEVFARASVACDRSISTLESYGANTNHVRSVVFASIVTTERASV